MKKFLLSTVALAGLTAGAMAADLPSRRVAPAPYVAVPVFTWTGFYVGVNAGYGFDVSGNNNNGAVFLPPGSFAAPFGALSGTLTNGNGGGRDGFVGGGQIGYNYQIGNFVIGLEADAQYADLARRNNQFGVFVPAGAAVGVPAFFPGTFQSGVDWFGTVRGRIGYAWDRLLVYGTGGFAYGQGPDNCNVGFRAALVAAPGGAAFACANDDIRTGWTGGGGVEYAFTPNVSAKVEGLYVNLNSPRNTVGLIGGVPVRLVNSRRLDNEFVVVRAGLNFKFGTW